MKTIYIDSEFKCNLSDDGTMTAVQTEEFDGKCDEYIEGFCYEPRVNGYAIYPWKDYNKLDEAQRIYERDQITDMQEALNLLGVSVDG